MDTNLRLFVSRIKTKFGEMTMSKIYGPIALGVMGILMAIAGAIILDKLPHIIRERIKKELRLKNGTDAYDRWQTIPVPITMKFYVFELNNTDTYTNLTDIQLTERGPYVFEETRSKEDIVFYRNDNNESVASYRERQRYKFREDLSIGRYEDNITFINLPLLGVIFNKILTDGKMGFELFKDELNDNEKSLFTTRSVGQLLFDGIDMKLYELLEPFVPNDSGIKLKPFSFFDTKNELGKEKSIFADIHQDNFGQIFRFDQRSELRNNDEKHSPIWPYHNTKDYSCNELRGTDASFYSPSVHKDDILYAFEPQICRTMFFKYLETNKVKGIRTLRFYTPAEVYESPLKYKPNSCYCLKKNVSDCDTDGGIEISHCLRVSRGAPAVVSLPYFLKGADYLRDDINLVPPKPLEAENYGTFIDVEPMTGTVLRAIKRLQISVKISHSDLIPQLNATKEGKDYIIPVIWLQESAEVTDDLADLLKRKVFNKKKLFTGISIASVVMGAFLIMIASYLTARNFK